MKLEKRIIAFAQLGTFLKQWLQQKELPDSLQATKKHYQNFDAIIQNAEQKNRWFIPENIKYALQTWADTLTEENLRAWIQKYPKQSNIKKVGVIQAGNIPLVGFHDFLSVLISNHIFIGKKSSKDAVLPLFLSEILISIEPLFANKIIWTERLSDIDAIIATGSDNTARYFEYYFGKYPNIIRKNRSSWAILTGKETTEELQNLGEDIFRYYGLGCRNISKLFVPDNYDLTPFFEAIESYKFVYNNNKYANNYDYNSSIYLMNQTPHLSNGFLILKEDIKSHSPLAVIFYEHYSKLETVEARIRTEKEQIQCVLSNKAQIKNTLAFGETQKPNLWDYADNIDSLEFLTNL